MHLFYKTTVVFLALLRLGSLCHGEDLSIIRSDIQAFKHDPRGPYQAIRWFCPDGSLLPAWERCSIPGGLQHALPKGRVTELAAEHHLYLGQVLAGTKFEAFFDRDTRHSRMKQYQLEKFLRISDDGWIHRRARYYRGAVQAEDEEAWGNDFLTWLVSQEDVLEEQFFLARQIAKDVPHSGDRDRSTRVRALAKDIAAVVPEFMNLRVKIHGRPEAGDVERVRVFLRENKASLPPDAREKIDQLTRELEATYRRADVSHLGRYLEVVPPEAPLGEQLRKVMKRDSSRPENLAELAELLLLVRAHIRDVPEEHRLAVLDLSIDAETILLHTAVAPNPRTLRELFQRNYFLAKAAAGCGFIEPWEWEQLEPYLLPSSDDLTSMEFLEAVNAAERVVAWGAGMMAGVYGSIVDRFSEFEPLSRGFIDERIRSSILLRFGEAADQLYEASTRVSGQTHELMGMMNLGGVRGLNPGFALGELTVLKQVPDGMELSPEKIYVLFRAPDDLEPVAGLATVSEGNAVSHVQLLARNLGIPNASLSSRLLSELVPYSGAQVFYAVSPRGSVVMKPADAMSSEEAALFQSGEPSAAQLRVPVENVSLDASDLLQLSTLRTSHSGVVCGPKAAHLGQLSSLFPDSVPAGLVIPFAEFHRHLGQTMRGSSSTYWDALAELFSPENALDPSGMNGRLQAIRDSIRTIRFLPGFSENLRKRFSEVFGRPMGTLRMFVRSDTNMEDLENFTGAGLNLTVAHIQEEEQILQAIRDVWASPFSERSYRWRRSVLANPLAVFPSVLLTPSVNVEKSGVLITSGTSFGEADDLTVAFNWGGAGAVGGQSAETYLLRADGRDVLASPSREPEFDALPEADDIEIRSVSFHHPILSRSERLRIRELAQTLSTHFEGALDVELGFEAGRLWLFQVRPFVQNEKARSSTYLKSLDRKPAQHRITLDDPLDSSLEPASSYEDRP